MTTITLKQFPLLIVAFLLAICANLANALEADAPFQALRQQQGARWNEEDREIDQRLQALRDKFGRRPNIIYILADDIGWGELGSYLGGKLRGTPTPNLDTMALQGMKFLSHYTEPSCTPTRLALLTGRHPVRTGVTEVLWPGQTLGLHPNEVTIAEVLSSAGYKTAMFGKWHVGELPEQAPENQGFDQAYYGLYNGAAFAWPDMQSHYEQNQVTGTGWFYDFPDNYEEQYGIRLQGILEAKNGQPRREVAKLDSQAMADFESESAVRIVNYIKKNAAGEQPFFVYWASYAQQIASSPQQHRESDGVDSRNNQAAQLAQHDASVKRILDTLRDEQIAENTLVVWVSDNGPMYAFWPNSGYSWLRGGKGEVYEGGVRTPGIAWWPGMIDAGQDPLDMLHIVDLFTTAARIAGAIETIPDDRITDGIDQTSLLLLGEGHSRRSFMFHYSGKHLAAIRYGDFKMHRLPGPGQGGLPPIEVYNIARDPAERVGNAFPYPWLVTPMQRLVGSHMGLIQRFPHRILAPGNQKQSAILSEPPHNLE